MVITNLNAHCNATRMQQTQSRTYLDLIWCKEKKKIFSAEEIIKDVCLGGASK